MEVPKSEEGVPEAGDMAWRFLRNTNGEMVGSPTWEETPKPLSVLGSQRAHRGPLREHFVDQFLMFLSSSLPSLQSFHHANLGWRFQNAHATNCFSSQLQFGFKDFSGCHCPQDKDQNKAP